MLKGCFPKISSLLEDDDTSIHPVTPHLSAPAPKNFGDENLKFVKNSAQILFYLKGLWEYHPKILHMVCAGVKAWRNQLKLLGKLLEETFPKILEPKNFG